MIDEDAAGARSPGRTVNVSFGQAVTIGVILLTTGGIMKQIHNMQTTLDEVVVRDFGQEVKIGSIETKLSFVLNRMKFK